MRRLSRLTELLKMDPKEMVDKAKSELDGFQDLLEDMVASLESENRSPGYIIDLMKTVRSWLRYKMGEG